LSDFCILVCLRSLPSLGSSGAKQILRSLVISVRLRALLNNRRLSQTLRNLTMIERGRTWLALNFPKRKTSSISTGQPARHVAMHSSEQSSKHNYSCPLINKNNNADDTIVNWYRSAYPSLWVIVWCRWCQHLNVLAYSCKLQQLLSIDHVARRQETCRLCAASTIFSFGSSQLFNMSSVVSRPISHCRL